MKAKAFMGNKCIRNLFDQILHNFGGAIQYAPGISVMFWIPGPSSHWQKIKTICVMRYTGNNTEENGSVVCHFCVYKTIRIYKEVLYLLYCGKPFELSHVRTWFMLPIFLLFFRWVRVFWVGNRRWFFICAARLDPNS